ncbi:MAG: type III secretion system chaperone [Rhodospirillaceae bacterium]
MDRTQAQALLSEFGTLTGLPDVELDEAGIGTFVVDDNILVSVGFDDLAGRLVLMATLDQCETGPAQMTAMLQANFLWRGAGGASFALTPNGDTAVLLFPVPVDANAIALSVIVQSFIDVIETWQKRLAAIDVGSEPAVVPLASAVWG